MKLARVWWGTHAAGLVGPPGEPVPAGGLLEPYVDVDSGQLYLLDAKRRDELDPRWRHDAS